jgi:hypothetical protein
VSPDDLKSGDSKFSLVTGLQAVLIVLGLGGGWVGKDAYTSLEAQLQATAINIASLQQSVETLNEKLQAHEGRPHRGATVADERLDTKINKLTERIVKLETMLARRR